MSAPITGQTITFEQISETLRTQYSDAEKRLQDSSKTQVDPGNDSNLLIVFYVQIMPDDFVMQLHRF